MPLYSINQGTSGGSWDLMQAIQALSGTNDVGAIKSFAQISAPGAPSVAILAQSGNLTGNYQYAVAFVTGYVQGQSVAQGGTLYTQGNTGGGTPSATVSPSAQQVSLSNIPVGPTGTVARILYRTQANGSSFFVLAQLNENTSTTYTDNTADANLGAAMPTTNTTGSWFQGVFKGDGSGLTNVPAPASYPWANLTGVPTDLAKIDVAQTWTGSQTFGAQSGGTDNGNMQVVLSDQYPALKWYSGTTAVHQLIIDVAGKIMYADGNFVVRNGLNGTNSFTLFPGQLTVNQPTVNNDSSIAIESQGATVMSIGYHNTGNSTSGVSNAGNRFISVYDGTNWHETDIDASGNWTFVGAHYMDNLGTAPASPSSGQSGMYANGNRMLLWNGSAWVDPLKYQ